MATIYVYNEEDDKRYQIVVTLKEGLLSPEHNTGGTNLTDASTEIYMEITTTIRKTDGSSFQRFIIRSLGDVAPGQSAATTWTDLVNGYVNYFITQAEYGMSSSSSSSSTTSSSSSSSVQYSSSSTSSSSTSSSSSTPP